MLVLYTIILAIIEGLTEFIPVSSTAHLLLAGHALGIADKEFLQVLSISIQSGAILASIWYFWNTIWSNMHLIGKVIIGFVPTGIAGILLYPIVKEALGNNMVIALALIAGGIGLLLITPVDTETDIKAVTVKQAFLIGLAQIFAFIPGMSRAGATLIGGTLLGIPRATIVQFSFLLAIPTIIGASVIELRNAPALTVDSYQLIALGTVVSFIVALLTIRWFIAFLTKKPLSYFGWYRIGLGLIVLAILA